MSNFGRRLQLGALPLQLLVSHLQVPRLGPQLSLGYAHPFQRFQPALAERPQGYYQNNHYKQERDALITQWDQRAQVLGHLRHKPRSIDGNGKEDVGKTNDNSTHDTRSQAQQNKGQHREQQQPNTSTSRQPSPRKKDATQHIDERDKEQNPNAITQATPGPHHQHSHPAGEEGKHRNPPL